MNVVHPPARDRESDGSRLFLRGGVLENAQTTSGAASASVPSWPAGEQDMSALQARKICPFGLIVRSLAVRCPLYTIALR